MLKKPVAIIVTIFILFVAYASVSYADSGDSFYYYYDFSGCPLGYINGLSRLPDGFWAYRDGGGAPTVGSTEENGRCIQVGRWGSFALNFPENIDSGVLKISFDIMMPSDQIWANIKMHNTLVDASNMSSNSTWLAASRIIDLGVRNENNDPAVCTQFPVAGQISQEKYFEYGQWSKIIMFLDYTGAMPTIRVWVDNKEVLNESSTKLSSLRNLMICAEPGSSSSLGDMLKIDNVTMSRFPQGIGLGAVTSDSEGIDKVNGTAKIVLSEPVDESSIVNENIVITHKSSGKTISNFQLESVTNTSFVIAFEGDIPSGRMELILKDRVKSILTALPMPSPIELRTKPEYVNGVIRPEIDGIRLYSLYGDIIKGTNVSELVRKAEVVFNTTVDEDSAKSALELVKNDLAFTEYTVNLIEVSGVSVMEIYFPKLLEQNSQYVIGVKSGVGAYDDKEVTSSDPLSITFNTATGGVAVFNDALSDDKGKYTFSIAKNSNVSVKYTLALCGYKNVEVQTADGTKSRKQLVSMGYVPLVFDKDDVGVFDYSFDTGLTAENCDVTVRYIWSYPSLNEVEPDEKGFIPIH